MCRAPALRRSGGPHVAVDRPRNRRRDSSAPDWSGCSAATLRPNRWPPRSATACRATRQRIANRRRGTMRGNARAAPTASRVAPQSINRMLRGNRQTWQEQSVHDRHAQGRARHRLAQGQQIVKGHVAAPALVQTKPNERHPLDDQHPQQRLEEGGSQRERPLAVETQPEGAEIRGGKQRQISAAALTKSCPTARRCELVRVTRL